MVGDTKAAMWNDTEAFPLMIRSAITMRELPEMEMKCQWLPVDTLAESMLEISGLRDQEMSKASAPVDETEGQLFYNLLSPHTFSWTPELCSALRTTDLPVFRSVPFPDWLAHLRKLSVSTSTRSGRETSAAADPNRNPAIKLVDFFAESFGGGNADSKIEIVFEVGKAEKASQALRNSPKVIESGLLRRMIKVWMSDWMGENYKAKEDE